MTLWMGTRVNNDSGYQREIESEEYKRLKKKLNQELSVRGGNICKQKPSKRGESTHTNHADNGKLGKLFATY